MSQPVETEPYPGSEPEIAVATEAEAWRRELPEAERTCRDAALAAIRHLRPDAGPEIELSVVLTDDARIRDLNRAYRGRDRATNVLSFPAGAAPGRADMPVMLGDVVLAYETIAREAAAQHKRPAHHLAHLVVHGTLHLFGYDHGSDDEAAIMERTETAILDGLGISDPYAVPASQ